MYTRVNPSFTIYKWGVRGSSLHGYVFVMIISIVQQKCFYFQATDADVNNTLSFSLRSHQE